MDEDGLFLCADARNFLRLEYIDTLHQGADDFSIQFLNLGVLFTCVRKESMLSRCTLALEMMSRSSYLQLQNCPLSLRYCGIFQIELALCVPPFSCLLLTLSAGHKDVCFSKSFVKTQFLSSVAR